MAASALLLLLAVLFVHEAHSCQYNVIIVRSHQALRICKDPTEAFLAKVNGGEFGGCLLTSDDAAASAAMSCQESETSLTLNWAGKALSGCSDELRAIELPKGATGPITCGPDQPSQSFHAFLGDQAYVGCLEHSTEENQSAVDCGPQALPLSISWGENSIDACVALASSSGA
jgi:hypothetical protein